MLPQQQNMISESVRIFQNIMKYHEIAYYCLVRCLNWRCKPYIYTIFLVSETAIFLQLLNHHWVCRSSARWHPPKGYRGYDWRQTIHDGTMGWSWKKSINSACFFPKWLAINGSHISRYGNILIYYDICIQVLLGGLNEDASVSGSIITSSVFCFCFGRGGSIMINYRNQITRIVFEMLPGWYPHLKKQPELLIRLVQPFLSESKIPKQNKI